MSGEVSQIKNLEASLWRAMGPAPELKISTIELTTKQGGTVQLRGVIRVIYELAASI